MKIGFIGLSTMGLPVAQNILNAGHDLTVYNRVVAKAGNAAGANTTAARITDKD